MFAKINSLGLLGLNSFAVTVEVEASKGLPAFDIVGLADASVRESRERIRSALRSSGLKFPTSKVMINLAPADVKKSGSVYDLAIAVALLRVSGLVEDSVRKLRLYRRGVTRRRDKSRKRCAAYGDKRPALGT